MEAPRWCMFASEFFCPSVAEENKNKIEGIGGSEGRGRKAVRINVYLAHSTVRAGQQPFEGWAGEGHCRAPIVFFSVAAMNVRFRAYVYNGRLLMETAGVSVELSAWSQTLFSHII